VPWIWAMAKFDKQAIPNAIIMRFISMAI